MRQPPAAAPGIWQPTPQAQHLCRHFIEALGEVMTAALLEWYGRGALAAFMRMTAVVGVINMNDVCQQEAVWSRRFSDESLTDEECIDLARFIIKKQFHPYYSFTTDRSDTLTAVPCPENVRYLEEQLLTAIARSGRVAVLDAQVVKLDVLKNVISIRVCLTVAIKSHNPAMIGRLYDIYEDLAKGDDTLARTLTADYVFLEDAVQTRRRNVVQAVRFHERLENNTVFKLIINGFLENPPGAGGHDNSANSYTSADDMAQHIIEVTAAARTEPLRFHPFMYTDMTFVIAVYSPERRLERLLNLFLWLARHGHLNHETYNAETMREIWCLYPIAIEQVVRVLHDTCQLPLLQGPAPKPNVAPERARGLGVTMLPASRFERFMGLWGPPHQQAEAELDQPPQRVFDYGDLMERYEQLGSADNALPSPIPVGACYGVPPPPQYPQSPDELMRQYRRKRIRSRFLGPPVPASPVMREEVHRQATSDGNASESLV